MSQFLIDLREHSSKVIPKQNWKPSHEDLAFLNNLHPNLSIRSTIASTYIEAGGLVGTIASESFRINVKPKIEGLYKNLIKLLILTKKLPESLSYNPLQDIESTNFLDYIIQIILTNIFQIFKIGIYREYREIEEDTQLIRGRINLKRLIMNNFGKIDTLPCQYDEFDGNNWYNQYIIDFLELVPNLSSNRKLRDTSYQLLNEFSRFCNPTNNISTLKYRRNYNRLNIHYKNTHKLIDFVLEKLGLMDYTSTNNLRMYSFLITMSDVFEDLILEIINSIPFFDSFSKYREFTLYDTIHDPKYFVRNPRIDLLLVKEDVKFVFEMKYTDFSHKGMSMSNLYQIFSYINIVGWQFTTPVLVYPISKRSQFEEIGDIISIRTSEGLKQVKRLFIPIVEIIDEIILKEGKILEEIFKFLTN